MDNLIRSKFDDLRAKDHAIKNSAYYALLEITDVPVSWAYEVWDELLEMLQQGDNHQRTIAAQILSNLAMSDPQVRMLQDFELLFAGTKDEKFVTARHTLQSIWKVGVAGKAQQALVVEKLTSRFQECGIEKNGTLIRYDIIEGLRRLYDATGDMAIQARALALIESEEDVKYRKKYAKLFR